MAFNPPYVHDSLAVRFVPLPQWLTIAPAGGRVGAGASQDATVRIESTGLLAGTYRGTVRLRSNDPARAVAEVPVRLDVRGAPDLLARPRALDFADVFVAGQASRTLAILDQGTDSLRVSAIDGGDPRVTATPGAFALAPGESRVVTVTFAPPAPGPLAATLTLVSDDPDTPRYPVALTGQAVPAPNASVAPESLSAALASNAADTRVLRVTNTGAGPYTFTVETLAGEGSAAGAVAPPAGAVPSPGALAPFAAGGPDAFGYTWRDSDAPGGPAFTWEDVRLSGTRLALSGDDALSAPVPIGFDFPFYGAPRRALRVCTNGWISFSDSTRVTAANTPLPSVSPGAPSDLLAAFWDDLVFGAERRAWVLSAPQRCVIQYQDVPRFGSGEAGRPNTFEIALFPDGSIEFRYLALRAAVRSSATVGIQDSTRDDGLQVAFDTAYLRDSLAVRFRPPLRWLGVSPGAGRGRVGWHAGHLAVRFDATALFGGTYAATLRLVGDDPVRPQLAVPCRLTVRGVPDARVAPASLDFGLTYQGWPRTLPLEVRNAGTDTLHVLGLASADAQVRVDEPKFAVPPLSSRTVRVTFAPSGPGTLVGALELACDDPDTPALTLPLAGAALDPPRAAVSPTALDALAARGTVAAAAERVRAVVVRNDGASPLHWTATVRLGPAIAGAAPPLDAEEPKGSPGSPGTRGGGGPDPFGYAWTDSDEPGGPPFAWVDARAGATLLPFVADDQTVTGIALPFAFPFYGRRFDHVNVCTNGWLSFTSARTTFTNTGLPDAGAAVPENLVAPLWDDQDFDLATGAGQASWNVVDGAFVVTFAGVRHAGGGGPYTYQAVLHPSGDIDFQYLSLAAPLTSATVGIQDSSRTLGLQVVANAGYLHDRLRVRIARVEPWLALDRDSGSVAPGATDTVRVRLRAADRDSARYRGEVRIASDDPAHPVLAVPCGLEVALERAALAHTAAPLSAALGGDTLRLVAGAGLLAHPLGAYAGEVPAPPRAGADGGWAFAFDLFAARAAAAAAGGVLALAIEDSARAWVTTLDTLRVPKATLGGDTPVHALGSGLDTARVSAGARFDLAWDDPAEAPATSWQVWLSPDGGHTWRPLALGLAERRAALAWPAEPAALARLEVTGLAAGGVAWSWLSDPFTIQPSGAAPPLAFALALAGPNPAIAEVALELALPRPAAVTLEVLDVRGARVRRDGPRLLEAGRHAWSWDGRDGAGRPAPPGLYLVRVSAPGHSATRRVILLR